MRRSIRCGTTESYGRQRQLALLPVLLLIYNQPERQQPDLRDRKGLRLVSSWSSRQDSYANAVLHLAPRQSR